jgi:hypothetical protein
MAYSTCIIIHMIPSLDEASSLLRFLSVQGTGEDFALI